MACERYTMYARCVPTMDAFGRETRRYYCESNGEFVTNIPVVIAVVTLLVMTIYVGNM